MESRAAQTQPGSPALQPPPACGRPLRAPACRAACGVREAWLLRQLSISAPAPSRSPCPAPPPSWASVHPGSPAPAPVPSQAPSRTPHLAATISTAGHSATDPELHNFYRARSSAGGSRVLPGAGGLGASWAPLHVVRGQTCRLCLWGDWSPPSSLPGRPLPSTAVRSTRPLRASRHLRGLLPLRPRPLSRTPSGPEDLTVTHRP